MTIKTQYSKDKKTILEQSKEISENFIEPAKIDSLPEPLSRYFHYVLPEQKRPINWVKIEQTGWFRTDPKQNWKPLKGEEYLTADPPSLLWLAKIKFLPFLNITVKDTYLNGKGHVWGQILPKINVVNMEGENINQGALIRCIAEMVWCPTALFPSHYLKWEAIDENSAQAIITHQGIETQAQFFINSTGQITEIRARRYKDDTLQPWSGKCRGYQDYDGIKLPTDLEAVWNLPNGDFSYAKLQVTNIEFNRTSPES
ncbi:hypothetical protein PN462_15270 [Spirulina sp. CS-785/01]|uniref:DUF6920 family protein n=1 Tax=Spirulina sp. CS-785/01 TaxID=3021716 RepID=UPI00232BAC79|nr:DUF6544 family protein [Spirulina sp. CS-785/01]MDB9314472.1 hypothetical protein [Spirulina sp. CS-785/01]